MNQTGGKTLKELASLYEVSRKVFSNWIKPHNTVIGTKTGHYFTPKQIQIIFSILGEPNI